MPTRKAYRLTEADIERLRVATGRDVVDPRENLFGPSSVTWRVNREAAILAGGGCALLLQVAHPLVAAGVSAHSRFRTQPLQRLRNTLELMLTIVFSDAGEAIAAIREIERRHARVRGTLDADIGRYPRGTPYDANDPELMFWVLATLVDTALHVYERVVAPLDAAAKTAYYEEAKVTARLFGIPDAVIPRSWHEFQQYMKGMINGDALAVGPTGRDIAASIVDPPLFPGLKQVFQLSNIFSIGLLPPPLRERYGYSWSVVHDAALTAAATLGQLTVPFLPSMIRLLPQARRAMARYADAGVAPAGRRPRRHRSASAAR
jgi:uncharacterized protein (DUF2236 family)